MEKNIEGFSAENVAFFTFFRAYKRSFLGIFYDNQGAARTGDDI